MPDFGSLSLDELQNLKNRYQPGNRVRKQVDKAYETVKRQGEFNRLTGLANQPFDLSFLTPEFKQAQEEPIHRTFGAASRRAFSQSLRTGGPVSAPQLALAGQEAENVRGLIPQNYQLGMDLANRRFAQNLQTSQFGEDRYRFEREMEDRLNQRRAASKLGALGAIGDIAGAGLALAFPPAAAVTAAPSGTRFLRGTPQINPAYGDEGIGSGFSAGSDTYYSPSNWRRFSLQRRAY